MSKHGRGADGLKRGSKSRHSNDSLKDMDANTISGGMGERKTTSEESRHGFADDEQESRLSFLGPSSHKSAGNKCRRCRTELSTKARYCRRCHEVLHSAKRRIGKTGCQCAQLDRKGNGRETTNLKRERRREWLKRRSYYRWEGERVEAIHWGEVLPRCLICKVHQADAYIVHGSTAHACVCQRCGMSLLERQGRCPQCHTQVTGLTKKPQ